MLTPGDAEKVLTKNLANVIRKANTGKPLTASERALIAEAGAGGSGTDSSSAFAKSYDELGQRLGISRKTLELAAKRYPDAPRPRADGRHDVVAWSEFVVRNNIARAAENIANAASVDETRPVTVTDWKAKEIELKCVRLETDNLKVAGQLVDVNDVEAGLGDLVAAFRQAVNNLAPRLSFKLHGKKEYHEIEKIVGEEIALILRVLQGCDFLEQYNVQDATLATASPVVAAPHQAAKALPEQRPLSKGKPRGKSVKAQEPPKAPQKTAKKRTSKRQK